MSKHWIIIVIPHCANQRLTGAIKDGRLVQNLLLASSFKQVDLPENIFPSTQALIGYGGKDGGAGRGCNGNASYIG